MTIKIAAAQYDIGFLENWANYQSKIERWVQKAADEGAKILVFPEYGSMELASLFSEEIYKSREKQLDAMQSLHDDYVDLYRSLAQQ